MDWNEQQARFGALGIGEDRPVKKTNAPKTPQRKKRGGIGGILESVVRGAAEPFSYLLNTAIVNPAKELSASATGNRVALRNARRESNREIGLGEEGTDLEGGLKKWAGNSAQALLTTAAPAVNTVRKGATIGAGTGGSAALTDRDSTLGDIATGAAFGGVTGGGLSAGSKILSKLTNKAGSPLGKGIDAEASGIARGTPLKGGRTVTPEYEQELQDFMRSGSKAYIPTGIKAGKPRKQSTQAQEVFNNVKKKLNTTLDDINREIGDPDKISITSRVQKLLDDDAGITGTTKTWGKFEQKLKKATDLKGLEKIRREADDLAFSSEKAGKTSAARQARHVRDEIDNYITPESEAYKAVKKDYRLAKDALELTAKGSRSAKGGRVPLISVEAGKQSVSGAKSKAGDVLNKLTGIVPETPNIPGADLAGGFLGRMTRQGLTANAGAAAIPEVEQAAQPEVSEADQEVEDIDPGFEYLRQVQSGEAGGGAFDPANIQAQAQAILEQGGTLKDVAEYMGIVESMQKLSGTGASKPLNSTAAGVVADTKTGLSTLQKLAGQIGESGANNPLTAWFRGRNPYDTNAQNLQANIAVAKQIVGKALEGGVLRKEDEVKYAKILPKLSDTDAVAQNKIQQLIQLIGGRLGEYESGISGGSGGTDLAELGIMQ